jgi:hypothetical protein
VVGTWRVRKIADSKILEAGVEKAEADPNIGVGDSLSFLHMG